MSFVTPFSNLNYRHRHFSNHSIAFLLVLFLSACNDQSNPLTVASDSKDEATSAAEILMGAVNEARIIAADDEPGNWLSHGRTQL